MFNLLLQDGDLRFGLMDHLLLFRPPECHPGVDLLALLRAALSDPSMDARVPSPNLRVVLSVLHVVRLLFDSRRDCVVSNPQHCLLAAAELDQCC
jgi:hypothetical protein